MQLREESACPCAGPTSSAVEHLPHSTLLYTLGLMQVTCAGPIVLHDCSLIVHYSLQVHLQGALLHLKADDVMCLCVFECGWMDFYLMKKEKQILAFLITMIKLFFTAINVIPNCGQ